MTPTTLLTSHPSSSTLSFYLNGTPLSLSNPNPHWTLLDFIRSQHGLKGTKLGCGEGGCGACTVVLQNRDTKGRIRHEAVNACLFPLVGVVGKHIITVEGLGSVDSPHPLQERLGKLHGSQCGFCTPGIVMSLYAMVRNAYDPITDQFVLSEDDIEMKGHLDGNLCRCTGYKPILQAAKTFVTEDLGGRVSLAKGDQRTDLEDEVMNGRGGKEGSTSCGRPGGCCRDSDSPSCSDSSGKTGSGPSETDLSSMDSGSGKSIPQFDFIPYTPQTELIYPPGLAKFTPQILVYGTEDKVWVRPVTIEQTLDILSQYPSAQLVGGASEVQVDVRFKGTQSPISVFVGDIPDLIQISTTTKDGLITELVIGGNASLSDIEAKCHELMPSLGQRASVLEAVAKILRYFGGRQIRNAASLAGNIATASPISDMNPLLLATNSTVITRTVDGEQTLPVKSMFLGYRKTSLPPRSVITQIRVPLPPPGVNEITKSHKQAKRKDDDIAIVTAAFRVRLDSDSKVLDVALAYGGMAPTTVLAKKATQSLMGQKWSDETVLDKALSALSADFPLSYSVPGGMPIYRRTLALSLFFRFWHEVISDLHLGPTEDISEIHRTISSGTRDDVNPYEQRIVGKQLPHLSGLKHTTGEAEYIDDMPPQHREMFGAMVLSQRAHAKIVSVDWSPALQPALAAGYIDKHSIPAEKNRWGSVVRDEPFFAENEVFSHGQPIGLVYAETAIQAQKAARAVKVVYEDLPAILTIDEAIAAKSFFRHGKELRKGVAPDKMDEEFKKCDRVFEGTTRIGGQEHFYLETNAALVVPNTEDGSMEVWSSTQNTMETQEFVAHVTNTPSHRINARVKRMGGAFGGKESRSVQLACLLAVAAKKARRPMRAMLNRDEDMMTSGQRHPIQCRWKVGVMNDGRLVALSADCYNNAGFSLDMSGAVMDRCCTHLDNCYHIPNVHIRAWVCKTNTHSNTAFRGFGGPQAMFIAESYMSAIAEGLSMDIDDLRRINLYQPGQRTPFLQTIDTDWHVPILLDQLAQESNYAERKASIAQFNAQHKYRKRGISLIPTKFGISFATAVHLNQATASVRIYTDGSVLLHHGGTEMGQGLYTKMAQVAAQALNVPFESIYTPDTSSYQSANASPTAASSGSDLNGMAVQHACDQLNERLAPYRLKHGKDAPMEKLAHDAYRDRVSLSATGFWKMPTVGYQWGNYDPESVKPMYFYFTQGAAVSEVELDLLTGHHAVLYTNIKMDVGRSINPAIDYGQVEGAFIQGQGLFTMEESLWTSSNGHLATRGPGSYKIPAFSDIPQDFRVSFLRDVEWKNLRSIQTSKGVGEPPLFLGSTVLFALREAVKAAREMNGVTAQLVLDSPATAERLRVAVGDGLVERARVERREGEKGFFVAVA